MQISNFIITGCVSVRGSGNHAALPHSKVYLINAKYPNKVYHKTESDGNGKFEIKNISGLWDDELYKIRAKHTLIGETLSEPFSIRNNENFSMNVEIRPIPVKMIMTLPDSNYTSYKSYIEIFTYITTALGDPVFDGSEIEFNIEKSHDGSGSLIDTSTKISMGNKIVVKTLDGYARVGFGLGNDGTFTIKGCTLDNQSVTSSVNFITISKKPD